ncbi:flagellar biosynthesis protein [Fulvimonas soli]|jgi:flagellar biosynthesis protein|uniref:Flagellar biosynthesis protein n=1 Tax=Fulvimonas soli TaxID=155197 RepID=A0A316I112_9GAMM|nr:flagellar biosynthesis protein [Fulvimonas soli]PWK81077.1 flagellar biosynthesis protein [Fulvimonas soli]TNY24880.1 flagellar biosynthesis protein [Fulvimonas soli]
MNQPLPPAYRRVTLRLAGPGEEKPATLRPEALDMLLARARALGLPLHHDAQIAAVLAALRLRDDVPATLYAAAASVLASVYEAAEERG